MELIKNLNLIVAYKDYKDLKPLALYMTDTIKLRIRTRDFINLDYRDILSEIKIKFNIILTNAQLIKIIKLIKYDLHHAGLLIMDTGSLLIFGKKVTDKNYNLKAISI